MVEQAFRFADPRGAGPFRTFRAACNRGFSLGRFRKIGQAGTTVAMRPGRTTSMKSRTSFSLSSGPAISLGQLREPDPQFCMQNR
jgi:hypothetical protein